MPTGFDNSQSITQNVANNLAGNLAGVFSTRPNAKFMSGARCTLKMNGKLVGFAFGISWTINTTVTEINTIDDYLPYELAPQRITVEGTISALHIPGVSPSTEQWQANVLSFLFGPYISIEVRDSGTNQLIFATDKAMIVSRTEDLKVDQLANVTLRWRAIGFIDEKGPATPKHYDASQVTAATDQGTSGAPNAPSVNLQQPQLGSSLTSSFGNGPSLGVPNLTGG